jgi:uncharacterized protein YecE (DUF72 family)
MRGMEFGKLDDISGVDWTLPVDDKRNGLRHPKADPHLYFGTPAWGSKNWIGKIYPKNTPPDEFLAHYTQSFNCIELNTTHYRIPALETVRLWQANVPSEFRFCPKIHKDISHNRLGLTDKKLQQGWFYFLDAIQENLGPCFIQFHERFSYEEKALLFKFLQAWPLDYKLSIELRNPSWFKNGQLLTALADYLRRKNIGVVITDVAGRRDVLHSTVTSDWAMVRLIGNDLDSSDKLRLQNWSKRLKDWQNQLGTDVFLFIHQPDDIHTIELATLAEQLFYEAGFEEVPHINEVRPFDLFNQGDSSQSPRHP